MNSVRLADCAEKLRRADDDLRDVRASISRIESTIQNTNRQLSGFERDRQNVDGIRRTLDQQSAMHNCDI